LRLINRNSAAQESGDHLARRAHGLSDRFARHRATHANDDIELLDRRSGCAHALAQAPTQSVAVHRARHDLAPDDVADAAGILRSGRGDQLDKVRIEAGTNPENGFERGGAAQPIVPAPCAAGRR
jgi:hypothetical protein